MSHKINVSGGHEFGGVSTELKLAIVHDYLRAFTTALRSKFEQLWYLDAFAGTGERTVRHAARQGDLWSAPREEQIERRRGSAQIAIDNRPAFDKLVFMDKTRRHVDALHQLAQEYPDRNIVIRRGDANELILKELANQDWRKTRGVMFLDPYGMHVDWSTLQAIRNTGALDVWYLVSLAGLFRQAARDGRRLSDQKRTAITRMLGTGDWEAAWYNKPSETGDLFGTADETTARTADVEFIERYVGERLKQLFPAVLPPLRLRNDRGAPMFSLFFAISNSDGPAMGLATKIASHILKAGSSSQVRP